VHEPVPEIAEVLQVAAGGVEGGAERDGSVLGESVETLDRIFDAAAGEIAALVLALVVLRGLGPHEVRLVHLEARLEQGLGCALEMKGGVLQLAGDGAAFSREEGDSTDEEVEPVGKGREVKVLAGGPPSSWLLL
jgi:hypothetical protein